MAVSRRDVLFCHSVLICAAGAPPPGRGQRAARWRTAPSLPRGQGGFEGTARGRTCRPRRDARTAPGPHKAGRARRPTVPDRRRISWARPPARGHVRGAELCCGPRPCRKLRPRGASDVRFTRPPPALRRPTAGGPTQPPRSPRLSPRSGWPRSFDLCDRARFLTGFRGLLSSFSDV